ncbi:MAG TPA: histidine kinase, partial [Azonexus sp.]
MNSSSENETPPPANGPTLRKQAEEHLQAEGGSPTSGWATAKLVHELQVHQIELRLQNEELRNATYAAEAARKRYADLYNFAPVGFLTINGQAQMVELNLMAADLLGNTRANLIGWNVITFVIPEELPRWTGHLSRVLTTPGKHECELTIRRVDGSRFEAHLESVQSNIPEPAFAQRTLLIALSDVSVQRRAERERERSAHAARLAELSRRVGRAQEEERKRLSGEIHDRTSPNLAALRVNLVSLADRLPRPLDPALEALLADVGALIDDTAFSLREISRDLRPPVLDYAGLVAAIESSADHMARRTGIAVSVDSAGLRQRLAPDLESTLFRIANEALTNCAKHSHA